MPDEVKIVDMSEKSKAGGPVVAIGPVTDHAVDIIDQARPMQENGSGHFPWRWVLIPSLMIVGLIWIVSAI